MQKLRRPLKPGFVRCAECGDGILAEYMDRHVKLTHRNNDDDDISDDDGGKKSNNGDSSRSSSDGDKASLLEAKLGDPPGDKKPISDEILADD